MSIPLSSKSFSLAEKSNSMARPRLGAPALHNLAQGSVARADRAASHCCGLHQRREARRTAAAEAQPVRPRAQQEPGGLIIRTTLIYASLFSLRDSSSPPRSSPKGQPSRLCAAAFFAASSFALAGVASADRLSPRRSIASIEPSDHPRVNFIDLAGAVIATATVRMMQSHQNIPLTPQRCPRECLTDRKTQSERIPQKLGASVTSFH